MKLLGGGQADQLETSFKLLFGQGERGEDVNRGCYTEVMVRGEPQLYVGSESWSLFGLVAQRRRGQRESE